MNSRPRRGRRWRRVLREPTIRVVLAWVAIMALVTLVGTLGFYWTQEGWSFFQGLYMAVNVLATVGLGGDQPLDLFGKIWMMLLAFLAVALVFGTVGVMADVLMERTISGTRTDRRMQKQVDRLKDHFIVCGYGRVGSMVAGEMLDAGHDVVVVDVDQESTARAAEDDILTVPGSATSDETLMLAGIERARGLVTCVDSDPDNVYVVLTARSLNPDIFIVGRASSKEGMAKLQQAGADRAVSPYVMGGRRMAQLAVRPAVVDFIDAAMSEKELDFSIEEIAVLPDSSLAGVSVSSLRSRGVFTLAILNDVGRYDYRPADERCVAVGDHLIVSGAIETLRTLDQA